MTRGVDTPRIVQVDEVTVREMRVRFTGADSFTGAVEVRAYGRLIGHWFPPGTLPANVAPSRAGESPRRPGTGRPDVHPVRTRDDDERPAPSARPSTSIADQQKARDEILRKIQSRHG